MRHIYFCLIIVALLSLQGVPASGRKACVFKEQSNGEYRVVPADGKLIRSCTASGTTLLVLDSTGGEIARLEYAKSIDHLLNFCGEHLLILDQV